jgi:hypothetical protein
MSFDEWWGRGDSLGARLTLDKYAPVRKVRTEK